MTTDLDGETTIVNPYYRTDPHYDGSKPLLPHLDSTGYNHGIIVTSALRSGRVDLLLHGAGIGERTARDTGLFEKVAAWNYDDDKKEQILVYQNDTRWVNLNKESLDNLIMTLKYYRKTVYG